MKLTIGGWRENDAREAAAVAAKLGKMRLLAQECRVPFVQADYDAVGTSSGTIWVRSESPPIENHCNLGEMTQ